MSKTIFNYQRTYPVSVPDASLITKKLSRARDNVSIVRFLSLTIAKRRAKRHYVDSSLVKKNGENRASTVKATRPKDRAKKIEDCSSLYKFSDSKASIYNPFLLRITRLSQVTS